MEGDQVHLKKCFAPFDFQARHDRSHCRRMAELELCPGPEPLRSGASAFGEKAKHTCYLDPGLNPGAFRFGKPFPATLPALMSLPGPARVKFLDAFVPGLEQGGVIRVGCFHFFDFTPCRLRSR